MTSSPSFSSIRNPEPVIVVHLAQDESFTVTACGLPWVPETQNHPQIPRQLCRGCELSGRDSAT